LLSVVLPGRFSPSGVTAAAHAASERGIPAGGLPVPVDETSVIRFGLGAVPGVVVVVEVLVGVEVVDVVELPPDALRFLITGVARELARVAPRALLPRTTTRIRWPTSALVSAYLRAAARREAWGRIRLQCVAAALHRCQRKLRAWAPLHLPGDAWRVFPATARPVIFGRLWCTGRVWAAAPVAPSRLAAVQRMKSLVSRAKVMGGDASAASGGVFAEAVGSRGPESRNQAPIEAFWIQRAISCIATDNRQLRVTPWPRGACRAGRPSRPPPVPPG
jgi:hypothetical protein